MAKFDPDKLPRKRIRINKNLWTDTLLAFPAAPGWGGLRSAATQRCQCAENTSENENLEVSRAFQKYFTVRRG